LRTSNPKEPCRVRVCRPFARGNYILLASKAPNFIVPAAEWATNFPLKPYVAKLVPKRPEFLLKGPPGAAYSTLAR
jgi:hypothetical protein